MNLISKNVYIDKLDDKVNKYNNTYHKTIKIKPADVKSNTYINSGKEVKIKVLNLQLVILLEYQNIKIFAKGYVPKWSEEAFVIKKVKNIVLWTRKGNKLYVRWKGYSSSFNNWIDQKDII